VVEVWKDQRTNVAHELAAHTRAFRNALTPITGALYDQRWYRPL
jgi:quinol monooxygenase YgiN